MDVSKRYKDYSKKTQDSIALLVKDLDNDCPESVLLLTDLLVEEYELLFDAVADLKQHGYNIATENGDNVRNRAVQVAQSSMQAILKILSQFPTSPLAKGRIKKLNSKDEKVDINEYLDNLLK